MVCSELRLLGMKQLAVCSHVQGITSVVAFKKQGTVTFETKAFMLCSDCFGVLLLHFHEN